MPVIKSAKKKLRKDIKRQKNNNMFETFLKTVIKKARKTKTEKAITLAIKTTDKAAKKRIIHKNKAARLKSQLSQLITKKQKPKSTAKISAKKSSKKNK